ASSTVGAVGAVGPTYSPTEASPQRLACRLRRDGRHRHPPTEAPAARPAARPCSRRRAPSPPPGSGAQRKGRRPQPGAPSSTAAHAAARGEKGARDQIHREPLSSYPSTSARGESRTRTGLPPADFESAASAIPPLGPAVTSPHHPSSASTP